MIRQHENGQMKLALHKCKLKNTIQYLLIFLFAGYSGGLYFNQHFNVFISIIGILIILLAMTGAVKYRLSFVKFISVFLVMLLCVWGITRGSLSLKTIANYAIRILIAYNAIAICKEKFSQRFINVTVFLSVISLIGFFIIQVLGISVFSGFFEQGIDIKSAYFYNPFFAYSSTVHRNRNIGIYNEPGMYQIILCVAMILLLYSNMETCIKKKKKYFIILSLAIVTTQSTTGYINLLMLLGTYTLGFSKYKEKHFVRFILFVLLVVAVIILFIGSQSRIINDVIINKMFENGTFNLRASTGLARLESMTADIKIALQYPFGIGYETYEMLWSGYIGADINDVSSTSGLTTQLATLGVFPTVYLVYNIIQGLRRTTADWISSIGVISVYIFSVISEPTYSFTLFFAISMLQLYFRKKEIKR